MKEILPDADKGVSIYLNENDIMVGADHYVEPDIEGSNGATHVVINIFLPRHSGGQEAGTW